MPKLDHRLSTDQPTRVLMVCTGNICRSPMAEAVLRRHVERTEGTLQVSVDSAGTHAYHVGADADVRARSVLAAAGYPLAHTARHFQAEWFGERDLILAMDHGHLLDLRRLAAATGWTLPDGQLRSFREFDPIGPGDVPDPYYDSIREFEQVLDILERTMPALLAHLSDAAR